MDVFDRNVTFASVDLSVINEHRPLEIQKLLKDVMAMFVEGNLTPVYPINTMRLGESEQAFRLVQGRKHVGKIVLVADDDTMVKAIIAKPPTLRLEKEGTYVVAGGLGDLGRHVARFLACRGAGHIVLLSRRELDGAEQVNLVADFESLGAKIYLVKCDITHA